MADPDSVPDEFRFDGKDGTPVPAADLEETINRIKLGEEIEG